MAKREKKRSDAVDLTKINGVIPFWGTERRQPAFADEPCADSTISKLRDSLLVKILIRLPNPRSAVRCKSVCQRWKRLISSSYFVSQFVSHRESNAGVGDGEESQLVFPGSARSMLNFLPAPDEIRRKLRVLDSSDDLFLCGVDDGKERNSEMGRTFIVCNPFTKQWVALPLAPERKTRYERLIARLVCEPRKHSRSMNQRFRVVCMYVDVCSLAADCFCSVSGKWIQDGIAFDRRGKMCPAHNVASCNGKLYWRGDTQVVACDPFRSSASMIVTDDVSRFFKEKLYYIDVCASQGVVHLIVIESLTFVRSTDVLSVWRRDEGTKEWTRRYRVSLKDMLDQVKGMEMNRVLGMHPNKPEIVFLEFVQPYENSRRVLSCNLQKEELQFLTESQWSSVDWKALQPVVPCWPTRIPSFEKLRGGYDGSCSFWVQESSKSSKEKEKVNDLSGSSPESRFKKKPKLMEGTCSKHPDACWQHSSNMPVISEASNQLPHCSQIER